jgi:hypothetical protein
MSKASKFAQLRALRQSGKKAFSNYEVEEVDALYEEVDENQYKKIVRDRLNQDDFVVDDNGEGYADDGREEWDRVQTYYSESDEDIPVHGKERKSCKFTPPSRELPRSRTSRSQEGPGGGAGEAGCQRQRHLGILHKGCHKSASEAKSMSPHPDKLLGATS